MESILSEEKKYDHEETLHLLSEVRKLFRDRRILVAEYVSPETSPKEQDGRDPVEAFQIRKCGEPLYTSCSGWDDVDKVLDAFDEKLNTLLDHMDELLDRNGELDAESQESLVCYGKAVDKCINVYGAQRRKRMAQFRELSETAELEEELRRFFASILLKYIIEALCDPLYEQLKNHAGQIYEMVLIQVNDFLASVGVYTETVRPGDADDPELIDPTEDSRENFTEDYRLFDKIDKVYRYPYLFADGTKVADGKARIWRRRD